MPPPAAMLAPVIPGMASPALACTTLPMSVLLMTVSVAVSFSIPPPYD
jgi:hypothetical protein